tara:strand:+ start:291 stop:524 length:234 start_codon:yes stop_codon:yes gene_type:complete
MYDTDDLEMRGPYYVPWKKTSMDLYNKIQKDEIDKSMYANTRYKSHNGYIEGSTIGNVPLKKDEDESKDTKSNKKTD